eukprot:ANDGO_05234.mRNA.1 hypothetical protein
MSQNFDPVEKEQRKQLLLDQELLPHNGDDYHRPVSKSCLWSSDLVGSFPAETIRRLVGDITADVCVVGGGITGLSCALELSNCGVKVAVVESRMMGTQGATHHSCGILTSVPFPSRLFRRHPTSSASAHADFETESQVRQLLADSIDYLETIEVDCSDAAAGLAPVFQRSDFLLTTLHRPDTPNPQEQQAYLKAIGLDIAELPSVEHEKVATAFRNFKLPVQSTVIRNQAAVHPIKLMFSFVTRIKRNGSRVFHQSRVVDFGRIADKDATSHHPDIAAAQYPWFVEIEDGSTVRCKFIVLATHTPIHSHQNPLAVISRISQSLRTVTNTVIACRLLPTSSADRVEAGLADPSLEAAHSVFPSFPVVLTNLYVEPITADYECESKSTFVNFRWVGRNLLAYSTPCKVTQPHSQLPDVQYDALQALIDRGWGLDIVQSRWVSESFSTSDGLPIVDICDGIGFATGFGPYGLTWGSVAGRLLAYRALSEVLQVSKIPSILQKVSSWGRLLSFSRLDSQTEKSLANKLKFHSPSRTMSQDLISEQAPFIPSTSELPSFSEAIENLNVGDGCLVRVAASLASGRRRSEMDEVLQQEKEEEENEIWAISRSGEPDESAFVALRVPSLNATQPLVPPSSSAPPPTVCQLFWDKVDAHWLCRAHGCVYDRNGLVLYGPHPRPLERIPDAVMHSLRITSTKDFSLSSLSLKIAASRLMRDSRRAKSRIP